MRVTGFLLILICVCISLGCTSTENQRVGSSPQATPYSSQTQIFQTTQQTTVTPAITRIQVITASVDLPYGITISYPQDWQMEESSETGLRDYGRTTINIAKFFSPAITPERRKDAGPNVDQSTYTTLSIDVDPNRVSDFEKYFNLAVVAIQKEYGTIEITKHNYQLKISVNKKFSGYKSYQLDFDTKNMRGTYIFTYVDGTVYIFSFKNPSPYSTEVQDMIKSIIIVP